ncbi:MAG TPA: hypothetical protein VMU02_10085 [bacterium]|nr:hypothetical protein [bacterium]
MKAASALVMAVSALAVVLLTSCGINDTNKKETVQFAPKVRSVWWILEDKSNQPCPGPSGTAAISFCVYLEDSTEYCHISSMKVTNPTGGCWSWDSLRVHEQWNEANERFELLEYRYPDPGDYVALGDYALEVKQARREPRVFPFKVFGRCDSTATEGYVYSYSSPLEPRILKPAYSCSCCVQSNIATVAFDADDAIITEGCVWYYDSADSWIGTSRPFSYMGGVNGRGHNHFNLNISKVRSRLDHIRIALMAEPTGHQGGYRARSESLHCRQCLVR